jgi:cobalt/nickel transport system ATP-binding protein
MANLKPEKDIPVIQENSAIFELDNVGFSYLNTVEALNSISNKIFKGESIVILGANGSGKSTLLEVLGGLRYPTSGVVRAFGYPLTEGTLDIRRSDFARFFREKVGIVFQNSDAQLFSSTVYEELAFAPLQLDIDKTKITKQIEEIVERLDISSLKDREPHNLSGGEKKKVALGSVLSMEPEVLLLDEPTNNLDPRTREWLIELLVHLIGDGKTVVTATHDLDLAKRIASRIIVLNEDHAIAANGDPDEILNDRQLLADVNLIHEHAHRHGLVRHKHVHAHLEEEEHNIFPS